MSEDIKNAISDLGQTFSEFKKVNDERLENIEKGESTAYNEEKLSKLEAKLDSFEEVNQKLTLAEANAEQIKEQVSKTKIIEHHQTVFRVMFVTDFPSQECPLAFVFDKQTNKQTN